MVDIAIMIEGQDGLNWSRWQTIAQTVEECGYHGLFRSDHFTNPEGPYLDSLELWVSLGWLADNTDRIEFGPLVTPVSFRDPVFTARMATQVDDLSNGRLTLGVGAGWQEREHEAFGYDLLAVPDRLDRFEEGLSVITELVRSDEPVSFDGEYYELNDARLLPTPRPSMSILVGGNGRERTMPLAAAFADEWNGVFLTPEAYAERNDHLDELLESVGLSPDEIRRSMMTRVIYGTDREVEEIIANDTFFEHETIEEYREGGCLIGTGPEILEQLERLEAAGLDRIMLQWLELDDLDRLAAMADAVL